MREEERLQELKSYKVLDTPPEKELDELAEIASAICDTPIALVSFVDEKRQWFKSKIGIEVNQTPREDAFCRHTLNRPDDVLVVDDPLNDERFQSNPLVTGAPYIRFYAGAPLKTDAGNVLGTLCVIDNKARQLEDHQKKALKLLARKVMNHLDLRRVLMDQSSRLELSAAQLRKLTNESPGGLFQLEQSAKGKFHFSFISKGISSISPDMDVERLKVNPTLKFDLVYCQDRALFKQKIKNAYEKQKPLDVEYRIKTKAGHIFWHWAKARPEKNADGSVTWYGTIQDITKAKEYTHVLEEILFDIAHVARKPVASMLGLTGNIEMEELTEEALKEYARHLKFVASEMDQSLKQLTDRYTKLRMRLD